MSNLTKLITGTLLYLLGQTLVWYQINGQFISEWVKQRPLIMSCLGIPISYIYIYATQYTTEAFDGDLWPQRLIGFSMGMFAFAFLTYIHLNQAITLKTAVTLALATAIVVIQIIWK
jgi:ABC-type multidrug transport system permease subunit